MNPRTVRTEISKDHTSDVDSRVIEPKATEPAVDAGDGNAGSEAGSENESENDLVSMIRLNYVSYGSSCYLRQLIFPTDNLT
jgi:hypothetical protein